MMVVRFVLLLCCRYHPMLSHFIAFLFQVANLSLYAIAFSAFHWLPDSTPAQVHMQVRWAGWLAAGRYSAVQCSAARISVTF